MTAVSRRTPSGRLYYGWIVAGVTAVTLLVSSGVRRQPAPPLVPVAPLSASA